MRGQTETVAAGFASERREASTRRFQVTPDISLAADVIGDETAPPVLLVHGIGQTRGAWLRVAPAIARQGFRIIAIDMRGHGESDWCPQGDYSLDAFASDVRSVITQLGSAPLIIGASLGGISTVLACGEDDSLNPRAVALIDIVPWIAAAEGNHVRLFMQNTAHGFASVDEATDAVQRYLPHRPRPRSTAGLMKNLRPTADGRLRWHWDPRIVAPRDDWDIADLNARLHKAALALSMPVMLVRGTQSEIVSAADAARFQSMLPAAEIVEIPDARHMVVGDDNGGFLAAAGDFLLRHSKPEGRIA